MLAGRRYIVCRNHQEAAKDAADRGSIIAALERQLAEGDKALVGNTGYRRYLKTLSQDHFAIDPDKIKGRKGLTASSCCAPTPISIRSKPCSVTSSCGRWSKPFEQQSIC